MNKLLCSFIVLCFAALSAIAQQHDDYGYTMPDFTKGIVLMKDGQAVQAMLNYDMIEEQMQYLDPDQDKLIALNNKDVITVYVDNRKFVPASSKGTVFLEEVPTLHGQFYVQNKMVFVQRGKESGYGGTSQTTKVTTLANYATNGRFYNLTTNIKRETKEVNSYYIEVNGKYRKIYSVNDLVAAFKPYKAEIKQFAADKKTDFRNKADVAAIIDYAFSLSK